MTASVKTRPLLELHMEADEKGEVTPVIPVTWSFSEDLVDKLALYKYTNPYIVIAVGFLREVGYDTSFLDYTATKIYVRRLTDDAPKEYIQFSRPGTNVVLAFVVNPMTVDDEKRLWEWQKRPRELHINDFKASSFSISGGFYDDLDRFNIATFRHDVIVPAEMFAPEPSRLAKALVRQFFPNNESDQCDFRRRFLISLAASIPVQLYGIVARLCSLLYAIIWAKRDIRPRLLFALNPHDFGNALDTSFWYETGNGRTRKGPLKWLSPPQLLLYALIFGLVLLPGLGFTVISHTRDVGKTSVVDPFTFGDVLLGALIVDPIFAIFAAFVFFFTMAEGRRIRRDWLAGRQRQTAASPQATFDTLRLRAQADTDLTPDAVANKTVRLKFLDLKMKVCKPFARGY